MEDTCQPIEVNQSACGDDSMISPSLEGESQTVGLTDENPKNVYGKRESRKTSPVWNDFDIVEVGGVKNCSVSGAKSCLPFPAQVLPLHFVGIWLCVSNMCLPTKSKSALALILMQREIYLCQILLLRLRDLENLLLT